MKRGGWAAAGLALVLLAGCASVPKDPSARAEFERNHDPFEPTNRKIFAFNQELDKDLIKPLAKGYRDVLPAGARDCLRHFLDNLNEPLVMANCLLQGRFKSAGISFYRFLIDCSAGVGGIEDVATEWKQPKQVGDFGQTLWAWGVPEGPYLIIPVFGPTSPRDGIGQGVDVYGDIFRYVPFHYDHATLLSVSQAVADGIDKRSRFIDALDEMQKEAIDYYASFRSLYRQNRAAELGGQAKKTTLPAADFYQDPGN